MINIAEKSTLLLTGLLLLCFAFHSAVAQGLDDQLLRKRVTIKTEESSFGEVVRILSERYGVSFGVELSSLDMGHYDYAFETNIRRSNPWRDIFKVEENWIKIDVVDEELKAVIDDVVNQMQHYDWRLEYGVINIYPTNGRHEKLEKLLDLEIASFGWTTRSPISVLPYSITQIPEVKAFLAKEDLSVPLVRSGSGNRNFRLDRELKFERQTLREILNQITREKKGGWFVRIKTAGDPKREFIDIDI